ncbi:MAG: HAD hydrolase family protein [Chloroflexi bacterium]|nr:HAD hydrolase family protein [Chloroflexota bacterium]
MTSLPERTEIRASVRLVVFDFDGVFTDNTVWTDDAGTEWVRCWRGDGLGLQKLRDLGIPTWVLSTENHPVVSRRCEKLGIPCRQGLADKYEALQTLMAEAGVAPGDVVYLGNDINDAACLRAVGVPIVVHDAHADVVPLARFQTRKPGGFGAVREVCDWLASGAPARAAVPP